MPARIKNNKRRRQKYALKITLRKHLYSKGILITFLLILTLLLFSISFKHDKWSNDGYLSVAVVGDSPDVTVIIANPEDDHLVTIIIPGNTEVDSARNFGILPLKNIWRLSQEQGTSGELLPETITRYFYFPTTSYLRIRGSIDSTHKLSGLHRMFLDVETNLSFADRVSLALFIFRVRNIDNVQYDLSKSRMLSSSVLSDGSEGFIYNRNPSGNITTYFHDQSLRRNSPKIKIVNRTGNRLLVEQIGKVFESLGVKVSFFENKEVSDNDCTLIYKNFDSVSKLNELFDCELEEASFEEGYDVTMDIGVLFSKRY